MAIIDERIVRIGSANLNNRSSGFDTECDAVLEARTEAEAGAIARFRARLVGHFVGHAPADVEVMTAQRGLAATIDFLARASQGRLSPLAPVPMGPLASVIADYHLGDPLDASDSWRPLMRKRRLESEAEDEARELRPLSDRS